MRLPWIRGSIERVSWLSDDTLLAIGWCVAPATAVSASLDADGSRIDVAAHWIAYARPDIRADVDAGRVVLLTFPSARRRRSGRLRLEAAGTRFSVDLRALEKIATDPATALRQSIGWTDTRTRADILSFLRRTLIGPAGAQRTARASLAAIRDGLRDPLPERLPARDQPNAVQLDHVLRIDERIFYLKGWAYGGPAGEARLTVVAPEGQRTELLGTAFRYHRPDVAQVFGPGAINGGFIAHVALDEPSLLSHGWMVELVGHDGTACQSAAPPVETPEMAAIRERVLADTDLDRGMALIATHAYPVLDRVQQLDASLEAIADVRDHGMMPGSPVLSIVIPLYERLDLLEHQLAHFIDDPDLHEAELIYVLDSPEQALSLQEIARQLHDLYRLPFRVVFLNRNLGFSGASNAGVSTTRGRLVLLLNSDVFPVRPRWTSRMIDFYDAVPRIGALGAKLLFEDDTLQHAGVYFRFEPRYEIWSNEHYSKGLARSFPPANVARCVPAVTGACLMIARDQYLELGGLSTAYVRGDYEDSDLCLRLIEAGFENWYLPEVELYHLEGQSYGWQRRAATSRYNAWLHTRRRGEQIKRIMEQFVL